MSESVSDTLAKLNKQFADQLPQKLDTLRANFQQLDPAAWQADKAEKLHHLLHSLIGSSGTFGMQSLSTAARDCEERLAAILKSGVAPNATQWHALLANFTQLEQLARIKLDSSAPSLQPPAAAPRLNHAPLIHLVEDDPAQAEHLSQSLRENGFRVEVFASTNDFRSSCATARSEQPDAILMDMMFPEGDEAGAEIMAELKSRHTRCPPVVFASVRDDLAARLAAFRAGACRYIVKPLVIGHLTDLLDELTGRQPPQPYRVLMVDDDTIMLAAHAAMLRAAGMEVRTLSQPLLLMEALQDFTPDVVVLDVYMPDASGPELAAVLRERDAQLHLPILFLSAETDMSKQLLALNLGGDDFLVKPVQHDHLVAAVTARARRARQNRAIQQRLETTLYEREREHLALNQHAIVSIADQDGSITYVNDKFCEISGYSRDELLGNNHNLLKSGEHPPEFYQNLWRTITRGKVWQGEVCNRRKDGSFYWVESTVVPFLAADGKPYQYVSIRTDISRIKAAEAALRANEERLRRGQLYANIGTWEWNIQSGSLFWSERIAPLFGYPTGNLETTYENFLAAIHPDDRQAVTDAVNACVERDAPYDIEHRVVWPDGTVRWLQERGAVTRDSGGKPLQMLGVVQDIDERKRAVLALAETEERFSFAVEGAGDGIWDWDMHSNAMQFSRLYMEMLGYAENELPQHADTWLKSVHPDDIARVQQNLKDYLDGKSHTYNNELRLRCKDGNYKWILCRGTVVNRDKEGKPMRMIGIHSDITTRKEAENSLIIARDEADRANKAKSEFLSSMSHELRTPMNAILGFGQLLEYDDTLSAEHRDSVQEIIKAGEHLLELINEVLDLAKVESGRIDLSLEPVELCPIIEECMVLIGILAEKRNIHVTQKGIKGAALRADRTRLKQVLLNLLSNAVKYNREGGNLLLEVKAHGSDRLRILVTDTGLGIPQERLAEVFQPFHRLDAQNSSIEGTGIGLTITRRIVEMMGGSVDVSSEPGVGSTFWIELPIEAMPVTENAGTNSGNDPAAPRDEEAQHLVLYIEDNPSNLRLMAQILGRRKHIHLLTAHTPELGIELAMARHPELILLDINMPDMDGYQVLEILKNSPDLKSIPVVAVTANAMPRDIEKGIAAGFNDYLTKPVDITSLYGILDNILWAKKISN